MVLHFSALRSCLVGNRHYKKFSYHKQQNLLIYFLIGLSKNGWFKFFCSMANDLLILFRSFITSMFYYLQHFQCLHMASFPFCLLVSLEIRWG